MPVASPTASPTSSYRSATQWLRVRPRRSTRAWTRITLPLSARSQRNSDWAVMTRSIGLSDRGERAAHCGVGQHEPDAAMEDPVDVMGLGGGFEDDLRPAVARLGEMEAEVREEGDGLHREERREAVEAFGRGHRVSHLCVAGDRARKSSSAVAGRGSFDPLRSIGLRTVHEASRILIASVPARGSDHSSRALLAPRRSSSSAPSLTRRNASASRVEPEVLRAPATWGTTARPSQVAWSSAAARRQLAAAGRRGSTSASPVVRASTGAAVRQQPDYERTTNLARSATMSNFCRMCMESCKPDALVSPGA